MCMMIKYAHQTIVYKGAYADFYNEKVKEQKILMPCVTQLIKPLNANRRTTKENAKTYHLLQLLISQRVFGFQFLTFH